MKLKFNLKMAMLVGTGAIILATTVYSCKKKDEQVMPTINVVELAQRNPDLSILVSAVVKAGLANTLATTQNITVFAPTNAAFVAAGYPQSAIDALTPAQVTDVLAPLLKYHVLGTKVTSGSVPVSDAVATLNTLNIFASRNANGVFVNGIKVTQADVNASNGVVHVINGVLVPPTQTIAEIVIANPNFSLLKAAVIRANLATALGGPGKFTVFAPVNAGFPAALNTEDKINAVAVADVAALINQHAFATNIFASDLTNGDTGATLNATKMLTVTLEPVTVKIKGSTNAASNVTTANIVAKNGVIHIINTVLQ